ARTRHTRSRRSRPSTRSGRGTRRTALCRRLASSGSASSPTARSAAASSPDGSGRRTTYPRATSAGTSPRFQAENFDRTLALLERVEELAAEKSCTPGQLALAWVLMRGDDVVPIPGTTRVEHLEENVAALEVELTPEDLADLEAVFPAGVAAGDRYGDMS